MYHNFFIHLSVSGHLGCFHVLAIVNSAAMNNGIHVSFSILVSSRYIPSSEIAGSYGGFLQVFKGIYVLLFVLGVSIYIPTKSTRGFPFLHTLSSTGCLWTFIWLSNIPLHIYTIPSLSIHLSMDIQVASMS